jgi:hypothetical protein
VFAVIVRPSLQNQRPGLATRVTIGAQAPPLRLLALFFVPALPVYGGCARETLGSAGFLLSRFANLRTAATLIRLATNRGSSSTMGATPMTVLIPSKIRAIAHRHMAMSALRANCSLAVRLKRYNHHAEIARRLESAGGAR